MITWNRNPEVLEDHQISSKWRLLVPDFVIDTIIQVSPSHFSEFKIKSTNLPFIKLSSEKVAGGFRFINSVEEAGEFSIEVYENTNFDTFEFFNNWTRANYNPEDKIFYPLGFMDKRQCRLEFLSNTVGNFANFGGPNLDVVKSFTLVNAMCLGIATVSLSQDNQDPLVYSINLSIDGVESNI